MRHLLLLLFIFSIGCQGSLTEEQKKEMREGMKASEILKISEAEITEAAFQYGRTVSNKVHLYNRELANKDITSAIQDEYHVKILILEPDDSLLMEIEKQLIEAYIYASNVELSDNVQKIGNDSLLYTLPIMDTLQDGSLKFNYALGIRMPKKAVILSMTKN